MILFILITTSVVLWEKNFTTDTGRWVSDRRNPVLITYFPKSVKDTSGYVHIQGEPKEIGRSSAWLYVNKIHGLSTTSYVSLYLKGNGNLSRFRILFKNLGNSSYYYLTKFVKSHEAWKEIRIYLKDAEPIWSSNYPYTLTPLLSPDFFLFVENGEPGDFSICIDKIEVRKVME